MRDDIEPTIRRMPDDTAAPVTYTPTKWALKNIVSNIILIPRNIVFKIYNRLKKSFNEEAYYKPYPASIDYAQLKITAFISLVKSVDPELAERIIGGIKRKYSKRVKLNFDLVDHIGLPDTSDSKVKSLIHKNISLVDKIRIMKKISRSLKDKDFINVDEYIKVLKIIELQEKLYRLEEHLLNISAKSPNSTSASTSAKKIDGHADHVPYAPGPSAEIVLDANRNKTDLSMLVDGQKTKHEYLSRLELDAEVMLALKDHVQLKIFKVLQREALRQVEHTDCDYKTTLRNLFARVFVAKHDTTSNLAKFAQCLSSEESKINEIFSLNPLLDSMKVGRSQIYGYKSKEKDYASTDLIVEIPQTHSSANNNTKNKVVKPY